VYTSTWSSAPADLKEKLAAMLPGSVDGPLSARDSAASTSENNFLYIREMPYAFEKTAPLFKFNVAPWVVDGPLRTLETPDIKVVDKLVSEEIADNYASFSYILANEGDPKAPLGATAGYAGRVSVIGARDPNKSVFVYTSTWSSAPADLKEKLAAMLPGSVDGPLSTLK